MALVRQYLQRKSLAYTFLHVRLVSAGRFSGFVKMCPLTIFDEVVQWDVELLDQFKQISFLMCMKGCKNSPRLGQTPEFFQVLSSLMMSKTDDITVPTWWRNFYIIKMNFQSLYQTNTISKTFWQTVITRRKMNN